MKTPREILLGRHQSATPKLDALRREAVHGLDHANPERQKFAGLMLGWLLHAPTQLWRELVVPSRRVWAGIATAWLLILIVNFSLRDASSTPGQRKISSAPLMTWQQQQLLAELANPETWRMADRVRTYSPRPRSEYVKISAT